MTGETEESHAATEPAATEAEARAEARQVTEPDDAGPLEPVEDRQARRDVRVREERDQLRTEVATLQAQVRASRWREVAAIAAGRVADVGDLRLVVSDTAVAGLYGEDGSLDTDAVEALLDGVLAAHPAWRAAGPVHHGDLGPKPTAQTKRATWAGVIGRR